MYSYQITDGKRTGEITTKHGMIHLPTFMPVTTFGDKYPLDKMVQPYLKRMSDCLMVSHFYAQQMKKRPEMPIFIDSGGFASLFEGSEIVEHEEYACIKTKEGDEINPVDVLQFQMKHADLGATLDFIIPPGTEESEALSRQKLTIQNALFVKKQAQKDEFMLYASLQCWDEQSARHCARIYAEAGFEGIAIGGMVPHAKEPEYIKSTVRAVREEAPHCAIHVFGCGNIELIPSLIELGADSFDSSSYARAAVDARIIQRISGIHAGLYAALMRLKKINDCIEATQDTKLINERMISACSDGNYS